MFTQEEAIALLKHSHLFFDEDEEDDIEEKERYKHVLNMNDVWGWATADGEKVPDDKLIEVATLFYSYGWAGILYWVSKRNNNCRSEFCHYNRLIDFVANEERIKQEVPDGVKRAYHKTSYTIGE